LSELRPSTMPSKIDASVSPRPVGNAKMMDAVSASPRGSPRASWNAKMTSGRANHDVIYDHGFGALQFATVMRSESAEKKHCMAGATPRRNLEHDVLSPRGDRRQAPASRLDELAYLCTPRRPLTSGTSRTSPLRGRPSARTPVRSMLPPKMPPPIAVRT